MVKWISDMLSYAEIGKCQVGWSVDQLLGADGAVADDQLLDQLRHLPIISGNERDLRRDLPIIQMRSEANYLRVANADPRHLRALLIRTTL